MSNDNPFEGQTDEQIADELAKTSNGGVAVDRTADEQQEAN